MDGEVARQVPYGRHGNERYAIASDTAGRNDMAGYGNGDPLEGKGSDRPDIHVRRLRPERALPDDR